MTEPHTARPVAVVGDLCGESPVWCAEESAVYWVDIVGSLIHRLTWPDRRLDTWRFAESPTALSLTTESGRLLVALASRLVWWWPESERQEELGFRLNDYPKVRFNEGRSDPSGRFWAGTMYNDLTGRGTTTEVHSASDRGKLFRIDTDLRVTEILSDIGISNTLCWSPDQRYLYFADSMRNIVRRFDFDAESGMISRGCVHLADYPHGVPDGSAVDVHGNLWNCRWGGGGIVRITADRIIDGFYPVPTRNLTSCTFGGADLKTLFITSARDETDPGDRFSGSLWALGVDLPGLPENRVFAPAVSLNR